MKALSILEIPEYMKKKFSKNLLGVCIDYKRFNLKSRKMLDGLLLNAFRANDKDNSDVTYDGEVAFMRVNSPRGIAHQVVIAIENIGPVPICYIEVYGLGQGLQGSVARIDFKGAFFHFIDTIPKRYLDLYHYLEVQARDEPAKVRCTRIDVAMDFTMPFPQNGDNWIKPCKNSKRDVHVYKNKGLNNSYGYLSDKNSGYGVRMYDKVVDINRNTGNKGNKLNWYGGAEKIPAHWTRIEFEFYPPYSVMDDVELMESVYKKTIGFGDISLGMRFRPNFEFKIESAYLYFMRYAKNHGISMETLIDEIVAYHIKIESIQDVLIGQEPEELL